MVNKFNTIKVINMYAMFQECNELEYLALSNLKTNNAITFDCMFQ